MVVIRGPRVSECVIETQGHRRHTVEQYGVRVEIPTKAHRISHSSTRSSLTGYSWPWFESSDSWSGVTMPSLCRVMGGFLYFGGGFLYDTYPIVSMYLDVSCGVS